MRHATASRSFAIGVLAMLVAGCGTLRGNPVPAPPPPPQTVGSADEATPERMTEWLIRDETNAVTAFRPLHQARSAVAEARKADAVSEHAAEVRAEAEADLERAEEKWRSIEDKPLDAPERLNEAAHAAHLAKRRAQIALAIGERERGLRRLADAQAALAERDTEDARWVGKKLVPGRLGEVRFATGTDRLTEKSAEVVARLAEFLDTHARYGLRLVGHSDNQPPSERSLRRFLSAHPDLVDRVDSEAARAAVYNRAMSERRARTLRDALVDAGVAPERLRVEGRGSAEPIADNDTAAGRSKNRRVEAIVVLR